MNGHEKRAFTKKNHIKKSALDLFNKYGVKKVSIDEIADYANVSKVTIYKYFGSKDGLYYELIKMIFDENIEASQNIIESDLAFLEKLNFLLSTKFKSLSYMKGEFIQELIKSNREIEEYIESKYWNAIKDLMFNFFDQGKSEGYIDHDIPNEIIYLYIEIFKAGLKEKASELEKVISDDASFENLINLFFYGVIKN